MRTKKGGEPLGKREDILRTTLELVWEEGVEQVTFAKIFERGSVGAGTFYHYFESKEQVLNTLYELGMRHLDSCLMKNYEEAASVWLQFETLLRNLADFARFYPQEIWFLEKHATSPNLPEELRNYQSAAKIEAMNLVRSGQAQWQIREIDPEICIDIVVGMLIGAMRSEMLGKYKLTSRQLQEVIDACWRAIKM